MVLVVLSPVFVLVSVAVTGITSLVLVVGGLVGKDGVKSGNVLLVVLSTVLV